MSKPPGAKDTKPRKKREDKPAKPLPSPARDDGRTAHLRVNGMVKPENLARIEQETGTVPEKLDKCLDRLRELEAT